MLHLCLVEIGLGSTLELLYILCHSIAWTLWALRVAVFQDCLPCGLSVCFRLFLWQPRTHLEDSRICLSRWVSAQGQSRQKTRLQGQFHDVNQEGTGLSDSKGRFLFPNCLCSSSFVAFCIQRWSIGCCLFNSAQFVAVAYLRYYNPSKDLPCVWSRPAAGCALQLAQ